MSNSFVSPSHLVIEATGIPPLGTRKAKEAYRCAMCGIEIHPGDMIDDFLPGEAFTDHPSLADQGSHVICGACKAIWNKDFTQKYSKTVISREGIFPFAKMEHQAYWLMEPPEPPFIMIQSDQQQQHLIWRAPVNLSREVFAIRYGNRILTIRRGFLQEAVEACKSLAAKLPKKTGKSVKLPFHRLDWKLESLSHGRWRNELYDLDAGEEISTIKRMSFGELWGACVILNSKAVSKPEAVMSKSKTK
jgi:CRISPR type IV-associated protein Csf1